MERTIRIGNGGAGLSDRIVFWSMVISLLYVMGLGIPNPHHSRFRRRFPLIIFAVQSVYQEGGVRVVHVLGFPRNNRAISVDRKFLVTNDRNLFPQ